MGAGHYCLIVNSYTLKKVVNEITYYFYPADDPFFENTLVVAPSVTDESTIQILKKEATYLKKSLKIITSNFALGVL